MTRCTVLGIAPFRSPRSGNARPARNDPMRPLQPALSVKSLKLLQFKWAPGRVFDSVRGLGSSGTTRMSGGASPRMRQIDGGWHRALATGAAPVIEPEGHNTHGSLATLPHAEAMRLFLTSRGFWPIGSIGAIGADARIVRALSSTKANRSSGRDAKPRVSPGDRQATERSARIHSCAMETPLCTLFWLSGLCQSLVHKTVDRQDRIRPAGARQGRAISVLVRSAGGRQSWSSRSLLPCCLWSCSAPWRWAGS